MTDKNSVSIPERKRQRITKATKQPQTDTVTPAIVTDTVITTGSSQPPPTINYSLSPPPQLTVLEQEQNKSAITSLMLRYGWLEYFSIKSMISMLRDNSGWDLSPAQVSHLLSKYRLEQLQLMLLESHVRGTGAVTRRIVENSRITSLKTTNVNDKDHDYIDLFVYGELLGIKSWNLDTDDLISGDDHDFINIDSIQKLKVVPFVSNLTTAFVSPPKQCKSWIDYYRKHKRKCGYSFLIEFLQHQSQQRGIEIDSKSWYNDLSNQLKELCKFYRKLNIKINTHNAVAQSFQKQIYELSPSRDFKCEFITTLKSTVFNKLYGPPVVSRSDHGVCFYKQMIDGQDIDILRSICLAIYYDKHRKGTLDDEDSDWRCKHHSYQIDSYGGYDSYYVKYFVLQLMKKLKVANNLTLGSYGFYEPFTERMTPYGTKLHESADGFTYQIALSDNIKSRVVEFGNPKHLQTVFLNAGDIFGFNSDLRNCMPDNQQNPQRWMLYFNLVDKNELFYHYAIFTPIQYPVTMIDVTMFGDINTESNRVKTLCKHIARFDQETNFRGICMDSIPPYYYTSYTNIWCADQLSIAKIMFNTLLENMAADGQVAPNEIPTVIQQIVSLCAVNGVTIFGAEHLRGNLVSFVQASNGEEMKMRNNHGALNFVVVPPDYKIESKKQASVLVLDQNRHCFIGNGNTKATMYVFFGGLTNYIKDDRLTVITYVAQTPSVDCISEVSTVDDSQAPSINVDEVAMHYRIQLFINSPSDDPDFPGILYEDLKCKLQQHKYDEVCKVLNTFCARGRGNMLIYLKDLMENIDDARFKYYLSLIKRLQLDIAFVFIFGKI